MRPLSPQLQLCAACVGGLSLILLALGVRNYWYSLGYLPSRDRPPPGGGAPRRAAVCGRIAPEADPGKRLTWATQDGEVYSSEHPDGRGRTPPLPRAGGARQRYQGPCGWWCPCALV